MYEGKSFVSHRWLGLSLRQAELLGIFGLINCLAVCAAVFLIAGPLKASLSNADQSGMATDTPASESAVTREPTLTPTITKTPIGNWREFRGAGLALDLPDSFVGGDPVSESARLESELTGIGLAASKKNIAAKTPTAIPVHRVPTDWLGRRLFLCPHRIRFRNCQWNAGSARQ
jgi:hypothetical protein